ncbi:hypothetical protein Q8A67_021151 [Cirrhinus molitorella]|uniref:Uncharacterized protein n=1 Tax=Cirrhinus molitorella TaxID=172907 RepID=A0AA88P6E1_9TELE|nr:hypothetical protein Q8A67_021151 [Cirrhinus molitorella]
MCRHVIKDRSASSSPNIRKPPESDLYSLMEFEKEPTAACRAASISIKYMKGDSRESPASNTCLDYFAYPSGAFTSAEIQFGGLSSPWRCLQIT